eukprot:scaffold661120_cov55-Prasinocladus_malaysianus.AAC.1
MVQGLDSCSNNQARLSIINSTVNVESRSAKLYELVENDLLGPLDMPAASIAHYRQISLLLLMASLKHYSEGHGGLQADCGPRGRRWHLYRPRSICHRPDATAACRGGQWPYVSSGDHTADIY